VASEPEIPALLSVISTGLSTDIVEKVFGLSFRSRSRCHLAFAEDHSKRWGLPGSIGASCDETLPARGMPRVRRLLQKHEP
jgi:hypothetical protein